MALLREQFRRTGEPVIATFQFEDIINGAGIVVFYGQIQQTCAATTYNLVTNTLPSRGEAADRFINQTNSPYSFNSAVFNSPRTITGTAIVICELHETTASSVSPTVTFQHVDASSNVTNISSAITGSGSDQNGYVYNFPVVLTKKLFKKGETLRVLFSHPTASNSDIACDPSGEYQSAQPMQFHVPFKIDL